MKQLFFVLLANMYCYGAYRPLSKEEASGFLDLHYFVDSTSGEKFSLASKLPQIGALDFRKEENRVDTGYEGVVVYKNSFKYQFVKRTTELIPFKEHEVIYCKCTSDNQPCSYCHEFQGVLRRQIFYCGDYLTCLQTPVSSVLIEQWRPDGWQLSSKLVNRGFKKIDYVTERPRAADTDPKIIEFIFVEKVDQHILYNCKTDTISIEIDRCEDSHRFFSTEEYYKKRYPWMITEPLNNEQYKVVNGDLVIDGIRKPLWISLFKKITFAHVCFFDPKLEKVYLKTTQGEPIVVSFNRIFATVQKIEGTPPYDGTAIFSWLNSEKEIIYKPIALSTLRFILIDRGFLISWLLFFVFAGLAKFILSYNAQ